MKPTVTIILTHKVTNTATGTYTRITAAFAAKHPTNMVPDIGHSLYLDIWEDGHPYEIKVSAVNHSLSGELWKQEVVADAELESPNEAPENGTIEELVQSEMESIRDDIAPRLLKQGFRMVADPNTNGFIQNLPTREVRRKSKIARTP